MMTEKSQDLPSVTWRTRKDGGDGQSQCKNQEHWCPRKADDGCPISRNSPFLLLCSVHVYSVMIQFFMTPWTVACQAPLSMGFPRQEYGMGCDFLLPGIFPSQISNLCLLCLLHRQADSLPLSHLGSPHYVLYSSSMNWMMPTHIEKRNLYSVYWFIQMLTSSRNILTDTLRNNVSPAIWAPLNPVKLTHKINHVIMSVFNIHILWFSGIAAKIIPSLFEINPPPPHHMFHLSLTLSFFFSIYTQIFDKILMERLRI